MSKTSGLQITAPGNELDRVLTIASAYSGKSSLRSDAVTFTADDDGVWLSATDLERWVRVRMNCEWKGTGKVSVPGKSFLAMCKAIGSTLTTLTVSAEHVSLKAAASKFKCPTIPEDGVPDPPDAPEFKALTMESSVFQDIALRVATAATSDDTRPILQCIHFSLDGSFLAEATDTHRIVRAAVPVLESASDPLDVLVYSSVVKSAAGYFAGYPDMDIEMFISGNLVVFQNPSLQIGSRRVDGQYPKTERVISAAVNGQKWGISVPRVELLRVLLQALPVLRGGCFAVRFDVEFPNDFDNAGDNDNEPATLRVRARSDEASTFECEINVEMTGDDPVPFALNPKYLIDMISSPAWGTDILLQLDQSLSPVVLTGSGTGSCGGLGVLMPMDFCRLKGYEDGT